MKTLMKTLEMVYVIMYFLIAIVAGSLSNFFMGTDLIDEQEIVKLWYSEDADEVRVRFTFKAGVQVAFPGEIVYFTL